MVTRISIDVADPSRSVELADSRLSASKGPHVPWPVGGEPACDGLAEWYVEARSVGPHPGLRRDVPLLGGRGWHWEQSGEAQAHSSRARSIDSR